MRERGVSLAARLHVGIGRGGKAKGGVVGIEGEGDTWRNETGIGTNLGSEWWGSGRVPSLLLWAPTIGLKEEAKWKQKRREGTGTGGTRGGAEPTWAPQMGIYDVTALFETGDGFAGTSPTVIPTSRHGRCQRESRRGRGRCAKLKARWRDVVRRSRKGHRSAAAWSDRPKRVTWTAGLRPCDTAVLV